MGIFVSCDHFLDEIPDNRAELNTKDKITKLLVSAYPDINHCLITEMASDNADQVSGTWTSFNLLQEQAYLWKDITEADVDSPMELWNACYKCIAVANQALLVIEQEDYTGMQAQIGEALLCRAYAHFILVNVFGKHYTKENGDSDPGIPYMERTETEVAPQYERMSVAGVYEKIDADIEKGLPLISDEIYSVTKYHFNRKAAYAFATRFNLYYGNYDKVIEYATQVLTGNPESVLRNWAAEGELDDNRNIRGDAFISADNRANLLLISSFSAWGRIHGPFHLGEKYVHNNKIAYDETCKASATWGSSANLYYDIPSYQGTPKVVMRKLNEYFEVSDPVNGIGSPHIVLPVFTTDETLLCRAEAYVMKKEYENAVKDLATWQSAFTRNKSLTRATINNLYAGMAYYRPDAPTLQNTPKKALHPSFAVEAGEQENFIHCILYMRRVLTLHEGLRWFDIKRYGIEIYRRTVYDDGSVLITDRLLRDDNRRAIQLPQEVINAGLKANPR
ncbi:hypothetical protein EZS27_005879 [termite gut metagenome]|uniref:SusD-like N-terminal domain-containing protein n=1 Tax=termite gut metagenome TaxID=433724 RepID=A0A5J4SK61_9ZZZZ